MCDIRTMSYLCLLDQPLSNREKVNILFLIHYEGFLANLFKLQYMLTEQNVHTNQIKWLKLSLTEVYFMLVLSFRDCVAIQIARSAKV